MAAFPHFYGNNAIAQALAQMIQRQKISQTILLAGPEGVGKATLARRFAAVLVGQPEKIERDDLSLPANLTILDDREKWTSEKRNDDPLLFSTHPDFTTFAPDGPLRQITIQQMRYLRELAQRKPLRGSHRVILIDQLHRANEQAANSLLKLLEEPPEHVIVIATAENLYDLLPTIRSRSVVFQFRRLNENEIAEFARDRGLPDLEARIALGEGCPGTVATLKLEVFRQRRELVLAALECGAGVTPFGEWVRESEGFSSRRSDKLDEYLKIAYTVLQDVLRAICGQALLANRDAQERISRVAKHVTFSWIELAVRKVDELVEMVRRNIQKASALDAFVISLRNPAVSESTLREWRT
ncbi:MAG TPA: AAA family ATPase [Bryobacteraceae bacterium]|jgi:DNA polymerase-3 subunit delta'|nr:AAA family ATPase [Bryobacteraceae bacterium]